MSRLDRMLKRLARPEDRYLFDDDAVFAMKLKGVARVALRFFWVYIVLLLLAATVTVASGMDVYHRTEMPRFCGACHEMGKNFASWEVSSHASVKCIDCHARPGISGWLAAKIGGTRQLVTHFSGKAITGIQMNEHHRQVVSENCQRCHPGATRLGERKGIILAHEHHLKMNISCVHCHSRSFAHPQGLAMPAAGDSAAKKPSAPLVDTQDCFRCHDGKHEFDKRVAFASTDERNCAHCHPDSELALQHGADHPSAKTRKPCLDCHEPAGPGQHYKMVPGKVAVMCAKCHEPPKNLASTHKPYAEGKCGDCHRVMTPSHLYLTGSKPTIDSCLSCHEKTAALLAGDATATASAFADGSNDLHKLHKENVSDSPNLCLECHSPHGSEAARASVRLRGPAPAAGEEAKPGTFTPKADGGSCSGACHGDDEMEYTRGGAGPG